MAAMDECVSAVRRTGVALWDAFFRERAAFLEQCSGLSGLRILTDGTFELGKTGEQLKFLMDPGKILIETSKTCLTGKQFYDILLEQYHLQMEMTGGTYVLAMTTVGDTEEGLERLREALFAIDETCVRAEQTLTRMVTELPRLPLVYTNGEIQRKKRNHEERRMWKDAIGEISTEYAYVYPPGIPLIVPGEKVTQKAVDMLYLYAELGFTVEGIQVDNYIGCLLYTSDAADEL